MRTTATSPSHAATPHPAAAGRRGPGNPDRRGADPARLRLLSLIQSSPAGEASVSDFTAPLGLSQPTVSHHLRILTEAGLLEREKRGVWAIYRPVPSAIAAIANLLTPPRKRATRKTR
ncbi:transcriptional regulator [Micromonospora sp. KC606]|nr:transcriptional regulator [Micromonospora sp. KC606]